MILGLIPVNAAFREADPEVTIYVRTNGFHTDIVVPFVSDGLDWSSQFVRPSWAATAPFVAFGWGDKRFYLETPKWTDLRLSTAATALLGLGDSVMRVDFAGPPDAASGDLAVRLSGEQYRRLIERIRATFNHSTGGLVPVPAPNGPGLPFFFEATGSYSAVRTCNDWTRAVLSVAGVRMPVWSPFPAAIFHHLARIPRITAA